MRRILRRSVLGLLGGELIISNSSAQFLLGSSSLGPPTIGAITILPSTFTAGIANGSVGTVNVPMSSGTFSGTLALGGVNSGGFHLSSTTLPCNLLQSPTGTAAGTYSDITITPTQAGATGSGVAQSGFSLVGSSAGGAVGYSVVVTMFGTATYNTPDGTVTGTPNGAVYTYNPDSPDGHTIATNLGNFVSDFAGFTQGCIHCVRDDTDLRVWFRKDVSPDPTRIEVILDLGKFHSDGSAANLGPFSLQILKAGVPQNIPVYTISGKGNTWVPGGSTFTGYTNVTTAYFPAMGYWSRWRWNPTPRSFVRTAAQLLPSGLNLLPNFNQALGTAYGATQGGAYTRVDAYSSAFGPNAASGTGATSTNYNPTGIGEALILGTAIGGTGDRPELGLCHEAACDWICNGGAAQKTAMIALAEADGGVPWHVRGAVDGWAPHDFVASPKYGWYWGFKNLNIAPYISVDMPSVQVPSAGNGNGINPGGWSPDLFHTPCLSLIPYLVTGDPFYLENLQDKATWVIGSNFNNRQTGIGTLNFPDWPRVAQSAPFDQGGPLTNTQSRGMAWFARDLAACILCTPSSAPSWLRPRSYWTQISTLNQQYLDNVRAKTLAGTGLPQAYPEFASLGLLLHSGEGYGLYKSYEGLAFGFLVNQAGQSNWAPLVAYFAKQAIEASTGSTGWDIRAAHQYGYWTTPTSTDYGVPTSLFSNWGDSYNFGVNAGMVEANTQYQNGWSINIDSSGGGPGQNGVNAAPWQASHAYHCNSWIVEIRGGVPVTPNAGDTISITFTGSFTGSPVTLSHTVTSGDVSNLISSFANNGTTPGANPLVDTWLIPAINANPTLNAAGIKASSNNGNWDGQTNTKGSWQYFGCSGRAYISFNSDGTSSLGGPVIGNITITGTFTTSTVCSLYIQPNGDLVTNGFSTSAILYHRALCYQCGASGTSATSGGPTGTSLTSLVNDNTVKWQYVPEMKSSPIEVPGGPTQANYPGWGGVYGPYAGTNPSYIFWSMTGLAGWNSAGIANALTGRTNMKALLDAYVTAGGPLTGSSAQRWGFSIAP